MRISVKNRMKSLIRAFRLDFPENLMDVLNDEKFSSQTVLLYYRICATHIIELAISNQQLGETKVYLYPFYCFINFLLRENLSNCWNPCNALRTCPRSRSALLRR